MITKMLVAAVAGFALASAAQAQVAVSIWTNQPTAASNATLAQQGSLGTPTATTTVNAINFDSTSSPTGYTVGGFLNNPAGLDAGVAASDLNQTYMYLTGSLYLNAGNNSFVVSHDDGLQLNIDGIGLVVDQPGPTSPTDTPFNVFAALAGTYNFELSYGETAGPPAQLVFNVNNQPVGSVPEPATWAMMLLGFGGMGLAMRRKRNAAVALAA